jgi:hypothetical protein
MLVRGHPAGAVAEVEGLCIVHKRAVRVEERPIVLSEILDAVEGPAEVMR